MTGRLEPKQVCRRNALAFLGYAAAFGLVASSAVLTASRAEAQSTTTPTTPTDAARRYGEVWDKAPSGSANPAKKKAGLPQRATKEGPRARHQRWAIEHGSRERCPIPFGPLCCVSRLVSSSVDDAQAERSIPDTPDNARLVGNR